MNEQGLAYLAAVIAVLTALALVASILVDHRRRKQLEELNRRQARMLNNQDDALAAVRLVAQGSELEGLARSSEFSRGYLACANAVLRELDKATEPSI